MKVLIAGGGTGGHLYPGVAIAEEVLSRNSGNEVMFVGTRRGIEARVIPELGYPITFIDVAGLKRMGIAGTLRGLFRVPAALGQSISALRKFKPDVAIGVGGYASGPAILAAWMLRIPTAVVEQNTVPGFTNRVLGKFAAAVYVMFESSRRYFPPAKVSALGNPIRRQLLRNVLESRVEPNGKFNILVLGGSQGAHTLNLTMIEAAPHLAGGDESIRIVHQTGKNDLELVKTGYREVAFETEVHDFIDDMSAAYRRADLVVCRAGATTLAEVMVAKKASILIPFPYASDNHQELNARSMVEAGAASIILERDLDGAGLAAQILELKADRSRLTAMEQAASRTGRPEAAQAIVDACAAMIGGDRS